MKTFKTLRLTALLMLVIGFAVGCAGTTEEATGGDQAAAEAAIAAAKSANAKANAEGYAWRDTGKLIKKAEKALKAGKYEEAIKLANKAKRQAELAVEQKYRELDRLKKQGIISESSAAPAPATVTESGAASTYEVVRGDNLWDISAKPSIYGNPYEWPLIYKANSDKIKDADLIYPGQLFTINTSPSATEVDAAVRHAKTRGNWALGVVEESDLAYLAR